MPAPTLLIGLGGLGASIVQAVHARVPDQYKSLVGVHILDTDANELKDTRYQSLHPDQLTQITEGITVAQCLERLKPITSVATWFPASQTQSASVMYKQMALGASQFRAISRLALLDTMVQGRLDDFNHALTATVQTRGTKFTESARIMIVNSLAGGTGSGSFLQVAMYVRDYFENQLHSKNIVVRGFVVMPDVFVRNGDYKGDDLIENVQANGYAALKEIDVLTRARANQLAIDPASAPLFKLALEYRDSQRGASDIEPGPAPFDYLYLYDYTRSDGQNLGSKMNYINQASETLYLQLFSPLVQNRSGIMSQEDNLVLTLVASRDRARLASTGVAKLIYPHRDVVEYCALKWATTGLSDDWLELDRLIDDELKQNEEDRRQGIHRKKPERYIRFTELLGQKANATKPIHFYNYAYKEAHQIDEDGYIVAPKSAAWLSEIKARIEESFKQANSQATQKLETVNIEALKDKDQVAAQVENYERGLDNYHDSLAKATQPLANLIIKEALWDDFLKEREFTPEQDTRLNTWLLAKNQAVHPVAVRYILSEVRITLEGWLTELESELDRLQRGVAGYKRRWDDPTTTDVVETASMTATRHAQSGWWRHMLQNPLRSFAEEYLAAYDSQRNTIAKWSLKHLEQSVWSMLRQHVSDMVGDWEAFFARLDDVLSDCQRDADILAKKHDQNIDPTQVYVCASADDKARLWDEECVDMRSQEIPENVAKQIYLALYRRRATAHFDDATGRASGWEEALFREHVVGWCREGMLMHAGLDLDIKKAIDLELRHAQANGKRGQESAEDAFRTYVSKLDHLAYPAIEATNQNFEFWCLNSEVKNNIGERLIQDTIGQVNEDGSNRKLGARDDAVAYPRQELSLVRMTYGISATDLTSMTNPLGVYRKAYEARVSKARAHPPTSYTAHLDWRWDSPAFLPEIDDAAQSQAMRDLRRATCYNLLRESPFSVADEDGESRWERVGQSGEREPLTGETEAPVAPTIEGLYTGLAVHYSLVGSILKLCMDQEEASKRNPDELPLIKQLGDVLEQLLTAPINSSNKSAGETMASFMIDTLCKEVIDMYGRCGEKPNAAKASARAKINSVLEASKVLMAPSDHGVEAGWSQHVRRQVETIFE